MGEMSMPRLRQGNPRSFLQLHEKLTMTIHVLLFGVLADQIGARRIDLEMPDGATAKQAIKKLSEEYPPVAKLHDRLAIAVGKTYMDLDHRLSGDDELALIPPVSGGCG